MDADRLEIFPMGLDIWATDPDNKPKPQTFEDDTVGRVHSGYKDEDGNAQTLGEFRFSTGDMNVAKAVAELFGGTPKETDSTSENFIDVFTAAPSLPIILAQDGIYSDMKLWIGNKLKHHCTGTKFLSHRDEKMIGQPCGCPELFAERKAAAKELDGPKPAITVTFRLADDPELGYFKFQTGSWVMAAVLHEYENALAKIDGDALADLRLELVEFTIKRGPKAGTNVSYYKPVIRVRKAYNDAIADAPNED